MFSNARIVELRRRRWPIFLLPVALCIYVILNYKIRFVEDSDNYVDIVWSKQQFDGEASCEPKINAVFLKLHKCASSTVQNIFLRYGHPSSFSPSLVPDPIKYNVTYNFLVHHSRFNHDGMQAVMPLDTVYVTVIRDPVDLFESAYAYFGLSNHYKTSLDNIAFLPKTSPIFEKRFLTKYGINQMLFDLGLNFTEFFNVTAIQDYIDFIDSVYSLVMVSERMDESLVLLRDLMCWEEDDVVVFKFNERDPKSKKKLNATIRNGLRVLNMADQMLYDFFSEKFEQRIKAYGSARMQRDVMSLRKRTDEWNSACVEEKDIMENPKSKVPKRALSRIKTFMANANPKTTCTSLTTLELPFTDHLRNKTTFIKFVVSGKENRHQKKSKGFKAKTI